MTKIFVVQHLDPELEQWSALEYATIAQECHEANARFVLCGIQEKDVETLFADQRHRVCLLDPAAKHELDVEDGSRFDVFVFGGILGDDPPRDRTSELRQKGFQGRRLGPVQMTTDTAARVTRMVIQERRPLQTLPYTDFPEIQIDKHESVQMPFRYIADKKDKAIMPEGMLALIRNDSEKGFGELLR